MLLVLLSDHESRCQARRSPHHETDAGPNKRYARHAGTIWSPGGEGTAGVMANPPPLSRERRSSAAVAWQPPYWADFRTASCLSTLRVTACRAGPNVGPGAVASRAVANMCTPALRATHPTHQPTCAASGSVVHPVFARMVCSAVCSVTIISLTIAIVAAENGRLPRHRRRRKSTCSRAEMRSPPVNQKVSIPPEVSRLP